MSRILVTEKIADEGLDRLRVAGHDVDLRSGLEPSDLLEAVEGAAALIIRSATQVTADVLTAGSSLVVVGRAGIGLDNVDVETATKRGVMVVNAPQSNIISTAEQTVALMLAQARNIPQADAALRAGRWERSKWTGSELAGRTLGVIGLGRIGKLVAQRASALGMQLVGYDPFVSEERARQVGVEPVSLDELAERSDVVTLHVVKTPETEGMIGDDFLSRAKDGVRIINVSRGGIVDEEALVRHLETGKVGGAALDVFANEPLGPSPLLDFQNVVLTPHLGASTHEAQSKAGITIAEQVALALAGDFVPFAVNIEAAEIPAQMRPYLPLAERLGALYASMVGALPSAIDVRFEGEIGGYDNRLVTLAAAKGALAATSDEPISYVNVRAALQDRGIDVRSVASATSADFVSLLTVSGDSRSISASLLGPGEEARIVSIDDHSLDVSPSDHMLIIRNDDRPGVIGRVGTLLGDAEINIDNMDVGRASAGRSALMAIATDQTVPDDILDALRAADGVMSIDQLDLSSP